MRLVMVGGGGFRVPLVYSALLAAEPGTAAAAIDEVVLCDVDADRLRVIDAVLGQLAAPVGPAAPRVRTTRSLDTALPGADLVFSAVRVGGLRARTADERVAIAHGLLGQETVGAGGLAFAMRTVPVATRLAEKVAALAPAAWVVNFTNPAGLVTEAMRRVLADRVIGICDSPVALGRRVARALGVDHRQVWLDYVGINHLGWLRRVLVDGRDRLPELLADEAAVTSFEEGRLFGAARLRELGAVPNEYVHYYEAAGDAEPPVTTRGEFLLDQQNRFFAAASADPGNALAGWRATLREREETYLSDARDGGRDEADLTGGGYEGVALALMAALVGGGPDTLVLDVANGSAVPGLDPDTVVEVPCLVDRNGAHPCAVGAVAADQVELMRAVRAAERLAIDAALTGSRSRAAQAWAAHPLVASTDGAARLLDGYLAAIPELAAVLVRD